MKKLINHWWDFLNTPKGAAVFLCLAYLFGAFLTLMLVNSNTHGPTHFNDEMIYWETAKSLHEGNFSIDAYHHYPPFYPLFLLPAFAFFSPYKTYAIIKLLNVLSVSSVIFPAYLLLRKFLDRRESLIGAALLLFYPIQIVMPRLMLSENLFYPLLMWSFLFAFTDVLPDRFKMAETLILGLLSGLLILTRYIALAVFPAILLIWWLKPFAGVERLFKPSWKKIYHFCLVIAGMLLPLAGWLIPGVNASVALPELLGFSITAASNPEQLTMGRLWMWAAFYLSYTILLAAPYLFLLLLSLKQFGHRYGPDERRRWFLSILALVAFFLVACIRHSWRAYYNYPDPAKLQGRYIMYFGPLFLLSALIQLEKMKPAGIRQSAAVFLGSITMAVLSYFVLFGGIFSFDSALDISRSSPFGYFILTMDEGFLLAAAILSAVFMIGVLWQPRWLFHIFIAAIIIFFCFGDFLVFKIALSPKQIYNNQIVQVIQAIGKSEQRLAEFQSSEKEITANASSTSNQVHKWEYALQVLGYSNYQMSVDQQNSLAATEMLRFDFGSNTVSLHQVNEFNFERCDCTKFTIDSNYYTIPEIQ